MYTSNGDDGWKYTANAYLDASWLDAVAEKYRALVAKQAIVAWYKLPLSTRGWISVEDLISDGMKYVRYRALVKYDWQNPRAQLITWLTVGVINFFEIYYVDVYCKSQKRSGAWHEVSIQALQEKAGETEGKPAPMDQALALANGSHLGLEDEGFERCGTVEGWLAVYRAASQLLKQELVKWFLLTDSTKFHLHGVKFWSARREFRKLAQTYRLDIQDCRHILRSPICLDTVSRAVLERPYSLENPTPGLRGHELKWPVTDLYAQKEKQFASKVR